MKKTSGVQKKQYDHWIAGRTAVAEQPRWSVIRDVLHWVR